MAGLYIDTSALGRVLLAEPDAPAIRTMLEAHSTWWSSALLIVEFRRLAIREGLTKVGERMLQSVNTLPVEAVTLERASRLEPIEVRSLDAIHLDAAIELYARGAVSAVLTFDRQLQEGCVHHGLAVEAPTGP